jgi:hypothetical protein
VGEAGGRVVRLGSLADRPEDLSSPQRHTFRVPPNPKAGFDGIVVRCQVLDCELAFRGAEFGWAKMLEPLPGVVRSLAGRKGG